VHRGHVDTAQHSIVQHAGCHLHPTDLAALQCTSWHGVDFVFNLPCSYLMSYCAAFTPVAPPLSTRFAKAARFACVVLTVTCVHLRVNSQYPILLWPLLL
jgi:hypothetical protein